MSSVMTWRGVYHVIDVIRDDRMITGDEASEVRGRKSFDAVDPTALGPTSRWDTPNEHV